MKTHYNSQKHSSTVLPVVSRGVLFKIRNVYLKVRISVKITTNLSEVFNNNI